MHKLEVSHNDIKPSNILWGRIINSVIADKKTLYCIDFGKASKIKNNIKLNNSKKSRPHYNDLRTTSNTYVIYYGTSLFAPISIIEGNYPTKKNDLIEMIYTLLFLIIGNLPWSYLCNQKKKNISSALIREKIKFKNDIKKKFVSTKRIKIIIQ